MAASVMPIFATPFGVVPLPEAEKHNPALGELLRARAAADARGGAAGSTPLCYLSAEDLLDWGRGSPELSRVCSDMLGGVLAVADSVNRFAPGQLQSFSAQARGSFAIVRLNGNVPVVQYSQSAWCAIYCVASPPPSQERQDSGVLRLHEGRLGTMFADATNSTMHTLVRDRVTAPGAPCRAGGGVSGLGHARDRAAARPGRADPAHAAGALRGPGPERTGPRGRARPSSSSASSPCPSARRCSAPASRSTPSSRSCFLAREDDTHRNPTPSHIPQDEEVFESRFNLFRWPESLRPGAAAASCSMGSRTPCCRPPP